MNMSQGGWQGYPQSQNQYQYQNVMGQNGGNSAPQVSEPPFVGRYIATIDEVLPRDVPMDGRAAIFPTQTLEEIYLKAWAKDGSIKTFRYILDPTQNFNAQGTAQGQDQGAMILERLEQLEQRFNDLSSKPAGRRNSKGGDENA